MDDPYRILGIPPDADLEAIKRAFRALALSLHPDMSAHPADHERFRVAREAHDLLTDASRRAAWDREHAPARDDDDDARDLDDEDDLAREVGEDVLDALWDVITGRRFSPEARKAAAALAARAPDRFRGRLVDSGEVELLAPLTRLEARTGATIPFRWHLGPRVVQASLRIRPGARSGDVLSFTVPAGPIALRVVVRVEVAG